MADESGSTSEGRRGLEGIAMAVVMWGIVAVSVFYFFRYGVPELASDRAYLDTLFYIILGITGAAYILYQSVFGWVIYRYRGDRPNAKASHWHESHRLEMLWTVGTAVILVPIVFAGLRYWDRVKAPAPEDAVTVKVDDATKIEFAKPSITSILDQRQGESRPAGQDKEHS